MIERGGGFRFLDKTAHAVFIGGDFRGQDFQRDLSLKLGIFDKIDLAHATRAELRADCVAAEPRVRGKRHRGKGDAGPRTAQDSITALRNWKEFCLQAVRQN